MNSVFLVFFYKWQKYRENTVNASIASLLRSHTAMCLSLLSYY